MNFIDFMFIKLRLRFKDHQEEKDFNAARLPLNMQFYIWLILALIVMLIPIILRYFAKHMVPQNYLAIVILVGSIITFFFRNKVTKYLEYFSFFFIAAIAGLSLANSHFIVGGDAAKCELFFQGYGLAMMHRLFGFQVVKFYLFFVFHISTLIVRFTVIGFPSTTMVLALLALEAFTIIVGYLSERSERKLFDSVYKSQNQLLKFKRLTTEYLPNPVAIVSRDYHSTYFVNNAFKKAFESEHIDQIKQSLSNFAIDTEGLEKNKKILSRLGYSSSTNSPVDFSDFIGRASQYPTILKELELVNFTIIEKEDCPFLRKAKKFHKQDSGQWTPGTILKEKEQNEVLTHNKYLVKPSQTSAPQSQISRIEETTERFMVETGEPTTERNYHHNQQENKDGLDSNSEEGSRRTFRVKVFLLLWDDYEAIALMLDNITYEKTIMELKVADKNKDLVIAMISHELRTPLNGIIGLVDVAKKMLKQPEIQTYLDACKNSGILLLNLVNSILDLSQIKARKLKLSYSKCSIQDMLTEIIPLFDYFSTIKNIYLKTEIAHNVPKTIITDKNRLSQIIINLLGNAFKFTFHGGVTIKVSTVNDDPLRIKFSIEDTGIGIKKEDQGKLFKIFGRIDNSKTFNSNGVGLGLTISNTLAILLDSPNSKGIRVESAESKGSCFSFIVESKCLETEKEEEMSMEPTDLQHLDEDRERLVLKNMRNYLPTHTKTLIKNVDSLNDRSEILGGDNIPSSKGQVLTDEASNKNLQQERPCCLIVDDNPFNLVIASHLMKDKGYEVKTALNGKEAIQATIAAQESGDLLKVILMDCQMPVMDGYEATRILRGMMEKGEVNETPIIALTANNQNEEHDLLCQQVGMSGCLAKPLQVYELERMLKRFTKDVNEIQRKTWTINP